MPFPPKSDMSMENQKAILRVCMLLGKTGEIAPERMKSLGQSGNDARLQMCLVVKVKSDAVENNIA